MNRRFFNSFGYAAEGIVELIKSTPNARVHILATFFVTLLGLYYQLSGAEWCSIVLAIGLVISAEAFNTALENLTDLASPEIHPLAKKAKDVSAGAVLIAAVTALVIGLIIFLPRIF